MCCTVQGVPLWMCPALARVCAVKVWCLGTHAWWAEREAPARQQPLGKGCTAKRGGRQTGAGQPFCSGAGLIEGACMGASVTQCLPA